MRNTFLPFAKGFAGGGTMTSISGSYGELLRSPQLRLSAHDL
ncbi:hypothetical protein [Geopseudomonas aromaticivorans]|nr:hypothetical protein [Pseudomonas aromaticivorans]